MMSIRMRPEGFLMGDREEQLHQRLMEQLHSSLDSGDLNEEDVWATWPDEDSVSKDKDAENFPAVASEPVVRFMQRRLGFERGGLSVAFEDSTVRSRFSPVTKTSGRSMSVKMIPTRHLMHHSAPVNVPDWTKIHSFSAALDDDDDDECEKLPPHEYLARSQTSSTCVVGRTLKGRDMSRVRNAVWRQTGFLG